MVQHEGLLELDAIYLFETTHRVVRYREQPMTLHYPDGTRLRRYTLDLLRACRVVWSAMPYAWRSQALSAAGTNRPPSSAILDPSLLKQTLP
jgi:hypothetical protein